jgi:hypothetical protein
MREDDRDWFAAPRTLFEVRPPLEGSRTSPVSLDAAPVQRSTTLVAFPRAS